MNCVDGYVSVDFFDSDKACSFFVVFYVFLFVFLFFSELLEGKKYSIN